MLVKNEGVPDSSANVKLKFEKKRDFATNRMRICVNID